MNKFENFKINLSIRWRLFKEKLTEIFVCRGKHLSTLLIDNETIVCDRCGKVLGSISIPKKEIPRKQFPVSIEEREWEHWLPKPPSHPRIPRLKRAPPAERHRKAIGKHMKGKGRLAPWYRKSIKRSPKIKLEEED